MTILIENIYKSVYEEIREEKELDTLKREFLQKDVSSGEDLARSEKSQKIYDSADAIINAILYEDSTPPTK